LNDFLLNEEGGFSDSLLLTAKQLHAQLIEEF